MTEDEPKTTVSTTDEDAVDAYAIDHGTDEALPMWITKTLRSARLVPGASKRLALWIPTLHAGWRSGRSGIALATALRSEVSSEEPLQWPDELAAEFRATLIELKDEFPAASEIVPLSRDIIDLSERFVDPEVAQSVVLESLTRIEKTGERAVRTLLEMAFFTPETPETREKTRNLHRLFKRLEALFDRALRLWLTRNQPSTDHPTGTDT